jgi:hypothetical protein
VPLFNHLLILLIDGNQITDLHELKSILPTEVLERRSICSILSYQALANGFP